MVIQKILFPVEGRCTEQELYFRQDDAACTGQELYFRQGDAACTGQELYFRQEDAAESACGRNGRGQDGGEGRLFLQKGKRVRFDTYFNGFSIDKWKKYTGLENLSVSLVLQGKVRVSLIGRELVRGEVLEREAGSMTVESGQGREFVFPYNIGKARGMLAFALEALGEGGILHAGAYCSRIPAGRLRDVRIGIGICTYRREAYVGRNLRMLREEILENPGSPLYGRVEVFIADNGNSLETDRLQTRDVHVFPNRNLGGAGGFTRTLIEMKRSAGQRLTHALLMDDDVVLEPEALARTYLVLALAEGEYRDAFVGGAMLRLDRPYLQRESGAVWNQGELAPLKGGLDLRDCGACLYNEQEGQAQYSAWWYCCFPLRMVTAHNLPLPLFIKEDDAEYGLRNMDRLVLMNGICVWHEPFEHKYSPYLEYYIIRNMLVTNALHCPEYGARQLNVRTLFRCMNEIAFFRYKNVDLYLRGIRDFLRGPQWLARQDGERLHREVLAGAYQWRELDGLGLDRAVLNGLGLDGTGSDGGQDQYGSGLDKPGLDGQDQYGSGLDKPGLDEQDHYGTGLDGQSLDRPGLESGRNAGGAVLGGRGGKCLRAERIPVLGGRGRKCLRAEKTPAPGGRGRKQLRVEKILALGGLLLPAEGEEALPAYPGRCGSHSCRSRRVVYYREADGRAFVAERSLGRTAVCMLRVFWMLFVNACCLKKAQQAYRRDGKRLMGLQFWKQYLDIR